MPPFYLIFLTVFMTNGQDIICIVSRDLFCYKVVVLCFFTFGLLWLVNTFVSVLLLYNSLKFQLSVKILHGLFDISNF